jgi:signal transduction histidine kinase
VDVESLVGHAVAMMEPCAQERGVTLEYRGVPASVEAMQPQWDAHAVQQALVNLLDNAIKFSPMGQRVLTGVEAAGENGEAPRLGIWVEDAGEGIPAEDHGRIFELFYRRGSELRRETGGVGIGLTIVKHVAEAHGGRVDLRSAVGEGSRFSLILPIEPPGRVKR